MQNSIRFTRHDGHVRAQALSAFRWRRRRKQAGWVMGVAAVLVAAAVLRFPAKVEIPESPRPAVHSAQHAPPKPSESDVALLSDEQLLAMFPPGSCYIAEVSGKKRLVFRTEELKTKYLN